MRKQEQKGKITALYERLSHDDGRSDESVSIENQELLCKGWSHHLIHMKDTVQEHWDSVPTCLMNLGQLKIQMRLKNPLSRTTKYAGQFIRTVRLF